jgi:hypothetical protein
VGDEESIATTDRIFRPIFLVSCPLLRQSVVLVYPLPQTREIDRKSAKNSCLDTAGGRS